MNCSAPAITTAVENAWNEPSVEIAVATITANPAAGPLTASRSTITRATCSSTVSSAKAIRHGEAFPSRWVRPVTWRAWHAGKSTFAGRENCNDFSVGVELEGTDDRAYTQRQYRRLVALTRLLMAQFPAITPARIAGHSDIAPGRKTDPGPAFDWPRFRAALALRA